jgi:hypothetical protein
MHQAQTQVFALTVTFILVCLSAFADAAEANETAILHHHELATQHFGNDAPWFEENIPFFECSDPEITEVYYYRWQLWKSHLKDLGQRGYIVTEFLNDVSWSVKPYQSLNDATAFHIYEGRWVKDSRYVNDYIDYMYTGGGNDRHFSEAIADAVYANYLVKGDRSLATKHLDTMQYIFHRWDDHYDFSKDLYYIEPLYDATEFSIASIDASGGTGGFNGGQAFRPTINSFMFANAMAISKLSELAGDAETAKAFSRTAAFIKDRVQRDLWNADMEHFVDRFKANNKFVHYWDFIRGRELAGYAPWYFKLPDKDVKYNASWKHLLSPDKFAGPFGLRTVEPSYEHYMQQYIYEPGTKPKKPECQWNGPSWPFDTTLVLGAMANMLNDYSQEVVHTGDYVRLLKQYAHQHYLNGKLNLQEDYNPDTGKVIVGLPRSDHYNHSCYNDLIISGLAGLRPRSDNTLEVNPLIPLSSKTGTSLQYLCLDNVPYHGQSVTIIYDIDGKRYGKGAGLSVYVNGEQVVAPSPLGRKTAQIKAPESIGTKSHPINLAVNYRKEGFPSPSASSNNTAEALYQAVDGRVWFYPEISNYWSSLGSRSVRDWFSLDFGDRKLVNTVKLYFYSDDGQFKAPDDFTIQTWNGSDWVDVPAEQKTPRAPIGNGENTVTFPPTNSSRLRVVFTNSKGAATALVEIKAY